MLQTVLDNPGRVSVEWPRDTLLWNLPLWQKFEQRDGLKRVYFDGCSLGVVGKHYPIRKPWCVSTSSLRLIQHLPQHQCNHSHIHESAEGSSTEQTGYYPVEMVQVLCEALYPSQFFKHNSAIPFVRGLVTQNVPEKVWLQDDKALDAVRKEAEGLRSNTAWSDGRTNLQRSSPSYAVMPGKQVGLSRSQSF